MDAKLAAVGAKSVQSYIDETPRWVDGTPVSSSPLTSMQWRIWCLAAAGKFFEGLVVFMTGVALPLIAAEFSMSAMQHGIIGAASLFGILIGALALGGLADTFGRKPMFIIEMIIFVVFLALAAVSPSFVWLVVALFGVGLALGCDYPTAHLIISESMPSASRGRLVLAAFGFQAVGALMGTVIGCVILTISPEIGAWRWMYATAIVPALLVIVGRTQVTESASWLAAQGKLKEARGEAMRLLMRNPPYPKDIALTSPEASVIRQASEQGYLALIKPRHRRATILAAVPWFLQDLSTYGIGIFTPTILAIAFGHQVAHAHNVAALVYREMLAAKGAGLIDVLLIVGILAAVLLSDKVGRIKLQIIGFLGCAVGLLLAALSVYFSGPPHTMLVIAGFMVFNFMTNLGPNSQTYLVAGEVFPMQIRARGACAAAAFAKIGAVLTAFLFPIFLIHVGVMPVLCVLVLTSLAGAVITYLFSIETTGIDLETMERQVDPLRDAAPADTETQRGAARSC